MKTETVTVEVKKGEGAAEKVLTASGEKPVYETADDLLQHMQAPKRLDDDSNRYLNLADILNRVNYAIDLGVRAALRSPLVAQLNQTPEAAFEKQVTAFVKARATMGKPVTEEQAKKIVRVMLDSEV